MLPRVRQYMDEVVQTLSADEEILRAVHFLLEKKVTGAPVINERREVIGMLSEKDCLRLLSEGKDQKDYPTGKVSEYMTTNVTTVSPHMNIYFVAGMFLRDVVRRFPVVENGVLVGAITRFDILRAIELNLPTL